VCSAVVACLVAVGFGVFACVLIAKERRGEPVFMPVVDKTMNVETMTIPPVSSG